MSKARGSSVANDGGRSSNAPAWLSQDGADVLVRVKAVPGASRTEISGVLGDRLKIRVSAPPEAGKANAAIARMLADACGKAARAVTLEHGAAQAQKTFRVRGTTVSAVVQRCQ